MFRLGIIIAIAGSVALASAVTEKYESQLNRITDGILRLIAEREQAREGTLRYEDLEKEIGVLNGKMSKTREQLNAMEATTNPTLEARLASAVQRQIDEMSETLEQARAR